MLFGWLTPALLAGAKSCARQTWSPRTAKQFHDQMLVDAYDRDPKRRGRQLATLRLVAEPVYKPLAAMPDSDYEAEGWKWLYEHPQSLRHGGITREDFSWEAFERWRSRPYSAWVVRFEVAALAVELSRLEADASRLQRLVERAVACSARPAAPLADGQKEDETGGADLAAGRATTPPPAPTAAPATPTALAVPPPALPAAPAVQADTDVESLVGTIARQIGRRRAGSAETLTALLTLRERSGWHPAEMARRIGVSEVWVSRHFAIGTDAELCEQVRDGKVSLAKAYEVHRAKTPDRRQAALQQALAGGPLHAIRRAAGGQSPPSAAADVVLADLEALIEHAETVRMETPVETLQVGHLIGNRSGSAAGAVNTATLLRLLRADLDDLSQRVRDELASTRRGAGQPQATPPRR